MNSNCAVFGCTITNRNTTMDTKTLRQKILDLAIHGKLVPQDPNDEPASVLLERIRAIQKSLIILFKFNSLLRNKLIPAILLRYGFFCIGFFAHFQE